MKVKINCIEIGDADYLWDCSMLSYLDGQDARFEHVEGKKIRGNGGQMFFFERYLEAKVFQAAILKDRNAKSSLYADEYGNGSDWVVITHSWRCPSLKKDNSKKRRRKKKTS